MAAPDQLPEQYFEVNGFRRVRGGEFFVEWRDVGSNRVAEVWIMYESTPSYANGWEVGYEVKPRGGYTIKESGAIGEFPASDFDDALMAAVEFMRRRGSGADDMSGDFSLTGGL